MKLIYIANTRMPTEMAHGLQIMKMCEAFVKQGAELELVIPKRFGISELFKKDPFQYYRVDKIFKIKKLFCFDLTPLNRFLGPFSFLVQATSFAISVFLYALFRHADIIYSRDRFSLFFLFLLKRNIVMEIHQIHKSLFGFILRKTKKIVAITNGLKEALEQRGVDKNKILVAPDGVDLKDFKIQENKEECRRKTGLPQGKKIVLYTGHLYQWKGVETLAMASKFLDSNTLIVFVGGIKWYLGDFKRFIKKNKFKNILVLGHKDYSLIPVYLHSADCLVLTGTTASAISKNQTSPMKMFEYMASKTPIIASSLPSFREILDEKNCIFVKSDNPELMADGIRQALSSFELSRRISEQAYQDAQNYTWDNRAKKIMDFICAE